MLTLELASIVLEIPNDAYTTLSQNLIGCSTLSQNEKATLNIKMPYCVSVTNINTNLGDTMVIKTTCAMKFNHSLVLI